jgi:phospholipid transport system substrate-binding protein
MRNSLSCSVTRDSAKLLTCIVAAALMTAIFLAVAPAAQAATAAETFVQDNINKGYAVLNDSALTPQQRGDKFRTLLLNIMDAKRIALFTLGTYAHGAKDADLQDFSNAFADFVTAMLQHDLASSPGETVTVTGSAVRAPDDVLVTAKLTGSAHTNGTPINVGFRVRKRPNGADALVDLLVEGVSMAMAQRSDFTAWLQQHHGDIAGLAKELHSRAEYFREQSAIAQPARTALDH